ncbi:MAG TPA: flagellin [Povalibacter sp.]
MSLRNQDRSLAAAKQCRANPCQDGPGVGLHQCASRRLRRAAESSRFRHPNLSTDGESLAASRSRIQDTDYAAETANLTRAQILQQAGTAMVAQANTSPQMVLQLLGR